MKSRFTSDGFLSSKKTALTLGIFGCAAIVAFTPAIFSAHEKPKPITGHVTFAFGGDVHFEGAIRTELDSDPDHFLDSARDLLSGADISMVNLETAITESGTKEPKEFNFRAPESALVALKNAGVDVVTEANNHGLDYGAEGVSDSQKASQQAGLPIIGIGQNVDEALKPYETDVNGLHVSVLAATQVIDDSLESKWIATSTHPGVAAAIDPTQLVNAVKSARQKSDVVVVYLHWGRELSSCPTDDQKNLATQLSDAGADIVVGSHAHVLEPAGYKNKTFVAYGLGNFIFYAKSVITTTSGVIRVTASAHHVDKYEFVPVQLKNEVASAAQGDDALKATDVWNSLRSCSDLSA